MAVGDEHLIGPQDDNFHVPSDDHWETETCWFSFCVPERKLMGYFYAFVRPRVGISGGGVLVWDDTAHAPWEVPYFDYQWHQPYPEAGDLRDIRFPNGMRVKMLEPLQRYEFSYTDRDLIDLRLTFAGTTPPHVFTRGKPPFSVASHIDQPGRVTGQLVLHGEAIEVDCYAMRDRSWGPRTDLRGVRVGYCFATASPDDAFLAFALPKGPVNKPEPINAGYLLRDGERAAIVEGERRVERDPRMGWATRVHIEARDEIGRTLDADGQCVNRIAFYPYPRMFNWTSMTLWSFNGRQGWGEDQDVWRPEQWSAFRRGERAGSARPGSG
jgi:hypothetical protein